MKIFRFAPSNTNQNKDWAGLHLGGCRTAFFNYVLAKQHGGKIICRLEDTDRERSNEHCLKCMIEDFQWTGIEFDAGFRLNNGEVEEFNNTDLDLAPLRQSQRNHIYQKYIDILLNNGSAYEKDGAIFFKMPKEDVSFFDNTLGKLTLPASQAQDFVIKKSAGGASFYFACMVDDATMGVTEVCRGFEHINSCYRQIALYKALDIKPPNFHHIPLMMTEDGKKMSKRDTSSQVNVMDFRKSGYLVEPLLTFASSIGWGIRGQDSFSIKDMLEKFDTKNISKAAGRFSYKKLLKQNGDYINKMDDACITNLIEQHGKQWHSELYTKLQNKAYNAANLLELHRGRAKTLDDFILNSLFLLGVNTNVEGDEIFEVMDLMDRGYFGDELEQQMMQLSINKGVKSNTYLQPLRIALTGSQISPPIPIVMKALGKQTCLERVRSVINQNQVKV